MTHPDYTVTDRRIEDDRLTLSVEIAEDVVDRAFRAAFKRIARAVRIPGFRAGKVPMDVLARRVGVESFNREVESELLPHYYYAAVEGESRRPVAEVEYVERHLEQGKPFRFTAAVDVAPEIELADYNALTVEPVEVEPVTDEQVDREIHRLRRRLARLSPPAEDAVVGPSDLVSFRYEASQDGKTLKTLSGATSLLMGDDDFLPGFGTHLAGLGKGQETTFQYAMPADYAAKALAGTTVDFKVKVFGFQNAELPEITDEFARSVGAYADLAALKAKIRDELEGQVRRRRDEKFTALLRDRIADAVRCDIPDERVERAVERRVADLRERFQGSPASFEEHLAEEGRSEADLRNEIRAEEIKDMKIDWALDQIALKEGLEVTEEEVRKRIAFTAQVFRRQPAEILEMLDMTGSRVLRKFDLLREKAFGMLKERHSMAAGCAASDHVCEGDDCCQEA